MEGQNGGKNLQHIMFIVSSIFMNFHKSLTKVKTVMDGSKSVKILILMAMSEETSKWTHHHELWGDGYSCYGALMLAVQVFPL